MITASAIYYVEKKPILLLRIILKSMIIGNLPYKIIILIYHIILLILVSIYCFKFLVVVVSSIVMPVHKPEWHTEQWPTPASL